MNNKLKNYTRDNVRNRLEEGEGSVYHYSDVNAGCSREL